MHTETRTSTRRSSSNRFDLFAGSSGVVVRPAAPLDERRLAAMLERTSAESVYRRFHGATGSIARREMHRIANPTATHRSWVAVDDGRVHGTITLAVDRDGHWEVAILVEDTWTHHGLGRRLLDAALDEAARIGVTSVRALVQPDNHRALSFFRAAVPGSKGRWDDGELELTLPVPAALGTSTARRASAPTSSGRELRVAG